MISDLNVPFEKEEEIDIWPGYLLHCKDLDAELKNVRLLEMCVKIWILQLESVGFFLESWKRSGLNISSWSLTGRG